MGSEAEEFKRVADGLSEVLCAFEAVDLNPLHDDDVRTLLDAKDDVEEMCQRYRKDQHASERLSEERGEA